MPPLRHVATLKGASADAVANCLAAAFVRTAGGELCGLARKLSTSKPKKKSAVSKKQASQVVPAEGILSSNPSSQVARVQHYLGHGVPKDRRQALLHQVLLQVTNLMTTTHNNSKTGKGEVGFATKVHKLGSALEYALKTLMDSTITSLNLTPVIHQSIKWVSTCKLNNRNPEETDVIDTVMVEGMLTRIFGVNALKLSSLRTIKWPHLVSGEIVRIIGGHCSNLHHLELACQCDATAAMNDVKEDPEFARRERELVKSLGALYDRAPGDYSVGKVTGCPNLKTLVLPRLDDEDGSLATHITRMLTSLKQLEHVSGAPMLVSLAMLKTQPNSPKKLNLRHLSDIDTYNRRPMPDISQLTTLLTQLISIELIVSQGISRSVTESFLNVKSLKIAQIDFHLSARSFKHLETLDINLEFQTAWPLLLALSRGRLQVRDLTLRHSTFQVGQEHEGSSIRLPSLKNFTLVRSSFIEYNAFKSLITGTPNLVTLSITLSDDRNYMVDEFCDDLICAVAPLLPALESFIAECQYKCNLYNHNNCLLSLRSVEALCYSCPHLTFIGHLDVWDLVEQDVNDLNEQIRVNNWNLTVV